MPEAPAISPSAIDRENPWPGLATFTEEQAGLFYGRDAEIRYLTKRGERNPLTVLFGQSGLGKSSLLQAGVFPRLRAASYWPIYIRLDHGPGAPTPTEQIKAMVQADTARAGTWTKPGSAKPGESLWEFFHHRDDRLVSAAGKTIVPVLVFDQFEELFTLGAGGGAERARAVAFMSELAELVENRPSESLVARLEESSAEMEVFDFSRTDYRVVITLREDYLPHLESLKTTMPALMENRMRLARMTGTQALEAVVKPGGALVTEDVARAIVEFVAGAKGGSIERLAELDVEPPLLSVICRELNERRRKLGQAQITADLVSGNRREILTDFYERSVADLPEGMRTFVEDRLLTKSGFRDNLALETALEEPGVTQALIDTLVARRLLRIEDRIGVQRVELTHDVLAEVIRAARDERQQRIVIAAAMRHARRQRWLIATLSLAVVALSIGAGFGIRARLIAKMQASQNDLVLGSRLLDEGKLADGLGHLVRAGRNDPKNEVIASRLLSTLASQNFAFPLGGPLRLPSPAVWAAYSADGKQLVCQGEDDGVRVIDVAGWKVQHEWKFDQPVAQFGVRADEKFEVFAVKLRDGRVVVCDLAGKTRPAAIRPPDRRAIGQFEISPDGRWVGGTDDAVLWLWDAQSGELRATVPQSGLLSFSPDSRRVATFLRNGSQTRIFSVPDGSPVGRQIAHSISNGRFFSRDGERIFVKHTSGVQAYDIATGQPTGPLLRILGGRYDNAMLSPDGKRIVLTAREAVLLDVATGQSIFPPFAHDGRIREAGFSRDGKTLFTNSIDGLFRLWDLETGRLLGAPMRRQNEFTPAALSVDGRQVAVFAGTGSVQRLQFRGQAATALELPRPGVRSANFLPGNPASMMWIMEREAKVFEIASWRPTTEGWSIPVPVGYRSGFGGTAEPGVAYFGSAGPQAEMSAMVLGERSLARMVVLEGSAGTSMTAGVLMPRRNYVARGQGNTITIWDLQSGRKASTITCNPALAPTAGVRDPLSADESRVAFQTSDLAVRVWEVATGRELFKVESEGRERINVCSFLADGKLLTGGSSGGLQVWDTAGRRIFEAPARRGGVFRFDHSRDGRYFAALSEDDAVQIWETAPFRRVSTIPIASGTNGRIEFSWDGSRVIAPASAGARIWDVRTGQPITGVLEHDGMVTNLYGPDGAFVTTLRGASAPDSTQRLWAVPPQAAGRPTPDWLLTLATICAGQQLTDSGEVVAAAEDFATLDEVRRTIQALPASDPLAVWGRWIVSDDPNRPVAPGFTITPAEAEKLKVELLKK